MSVLLGTIHLPALFAMSLVVSLLSQPITSWVITSSAESVSQGVHRFFCIVACVLTGFALLVAISHVPSTPVLLLPGNMGGVAGGSAGEYYSLRHAAVIAEYLPYHSHAAQSEQIKKILSKLALHHEDDATSDTRGEQHVRRLQDVAALAQDGGDAHVHEVTLPPPMALPPPLDSRQATFSVSRGEQTLPLARRCLFVAFYLWMSTQNLVSASVLWARCADVFPGAAAERVFGVLAAAATVGQLAGSAAMAFFCSKCGKTLPIGVLCLHIAFSFRHPSYGTMASGMLLSAHAAPLLRHGLKQRR